MAKNPLKYQPHEYYTYNLLHNPVMSVKEMESEYNRLRSIANSRLERLGASEFRNVEAYKINVGKFEKTARQYTKPQLARKLYEVSRFVGAKSSSVRGQQNIRKRTIASLHKAGFTFVNKDNLKAFGDFMEDMRSRQGGKLVDSDRVAEVYNIAREKGVSSETLSRDFDLWLANRKQLEALPKLKGKRHDSATYLRKLDKQGTLIVPKTGQYQYTKNARTALRNIGVTEENAIRKSMNKSKKYLKEIETDDQFE